ncbi:hypothetical protein [Cognatilysobacter bugurensis]|nr:hypothetical protein [Lysobacter bugurensis]
MTPTPSDDPVLARMGKLLGLPLASELDVFELTRSGLAAESWAQLSDAVPLPRDVFVRADHARLTLMLGRRFTPAETDRIVRAIRLFAQAHEALGSHDAATAWLCEPRALRPGQPPVAPWTLATTEAGARLCERLLGVGSALPSSPPVTQATHIDVDAVIREDANMSEAELAWAAALEEQRAAGLPAAEVDAPLGADVDIDAVLGQVAVDAHELDWAAALEEQAAATQGGAEVASSDDADAILAAAAAHANA